MNHPIIGVPSGPPVQTVTIPIPTGGTELTFLLAFALSELLPFLGGRFKAINGLSQGLLSILSLAKPFRKEDEAIRQLKAEIEELKVALSRPHPQDLLR